MPFSGAYQICKHHVKVLPLPKMLSFHMKKHVFACLVAGVLGLLATQAQPGAVVGGFMMPQRGLLLNADDLAQEPSEVYELSSLPGMAAGGILGYNFNKYIGVRMNLLYSQQGGRYRSYGAVDTVHTYSTHLDYVKLPLMVGMMSNPDRKTAFFIYGGYQAGFLTRAVRENDVQTFAPEIPAGVSDYPTVYRQYTRWAFSGVGEMGLNIKLNYNVALNVHLRGDYSLRDVENKDATYRQTINNQTQTMRYWEGYPGGTTRQATNSLNLGLLFGLTYTFVREPAVEEEAATPY